MKNKGFALSLVIQGTFIFLSVIKMSEFKILLWSLKN